MLSYTYYITHIAVYVMHRSRLYQGEGWEVIEHNCNYTSMRFWLQKLYSDLSNGKGFLDIWHTVSLGICRYFIFLSCGHDNRVFLQDRVRQRHFLECYWEGLITFSSRCFGFYLTVWRYHTDEEFELFTNQEEQKPILGQISQTKLPAKLFICKPIRAVRLKVKE